VAHANARTTVYARTLIVDRVLAGHRPGEVAKQLGVSRQTVYKWVRRWRAEGAAGLVDRSSRPQSMPRRTSAEMTAAIVAARCSTTPDRSGWPRSWASLPPRSAR
jgi:transposase